MFFQFFSSLLPPPHFFFSSKQVNLLPCCSGNEKSVVSLTGLSHSACGLCSVWGRVCFLTFPSPSRLLSSLAPPLLPSFTVLSNLSDSDLCPCLLHLFMVCCFLFLTILLLHLVLFELQLQSFFPTPRLIGIHHSTLHPCE